MKSKIIIVGLMLLHTVGCTGMNNTEQGALSGGLIGGLLGLAVGGRHPGTAALVGAGGGAIAGGLIGNSMDRREDRAKADAIAAANARAAQQMTLPEIVQMAQQNVGADLIIRQIERTGSIFPNLSSDDIIYLRNERVPDSVISYMQSRTTRRVVVVREGYPYPPPPPGYYAEPGVAIGVGVGRRW